MTLDIRKGLKRLEALLPLLSNSLTLDETTRELGSEIAKYIAIKNLFLVYVSNNNILKHDEIGSWDRKEAEGSKELVQALTLRWNKLLNHIQKGNIVLRPHFLGIPTVNEQENIFFFPIHFDNRLCGMLLFSLDKENLTEGEQEYLQLVSNLLSLKCAYEVSFAKENINNFVFNKVLDGMKTSIYISDPETDFILYMNQTMKEEFELQEPEGCICWKELQKEMNHRCPFCPIAELKKKPLGAVVQWEEKNSRTGKIYQNYDSLIQWTDGRIVHLQQSVDITELKFINTDDLTQFMNRRVGKDAMGRALEAAHTKNRTVTVCMYDIDGLNHVNNLYGHSEGNQLISLIGNSVKNILKEGEFAFRLNGDEFIVVFKCTQKRAEKRIEDVRKKLANIKRSYEVSFCYGMVEIEPGKEMSVEETLFLVDERMYEKKRRLHILMNESMRMEQETTLDEGTFEYNANLLYNSLVKSTDDYIYVCNMKTGVFKYTKEMVEEFELPGQVIQNAAAIWGARVHHNDKPAFLESNQDIVDGRCTSHCVEYRALNRKKEWVWVRCRGHVSFDENGQPELFAGFISNLGKKNMIDNLTGLYNKLEFEEKIGFLIESQSSIEFGIMILGIDDLKHINNLYNRTFGDEVIRITGEKLRMILPGTAALYRLDGDEFGVIMRSNRDGRIQEEMEQVFRLIRHSFESQQEYEREKFYCTLSGGAVQYPKDAQNYQDIMKYAGYSLDYSKKHGKKRCTFFSQELLGKQERSLGMLEELRGSIKSDFSGFTVYYQPLVRAKDGMITGAEALSRWECDRYGKVSPGEFIPLLEQSGLIVEFGMWMLGEALRDSRRWIEEIPDFILDVNISYIQMQEEDFADNIKKTISQCKYPTKNLVIELTESCFAEENRIITDFFKEMRDMGVRVAMDDFGTGYSTLGLLKESPADIVKIDKTFVKDIRNSSFDATFIQFVVALCHNVGIKVCLEGVETQREYELVKEMGLDIIQGFLFAKPMTEKELNKCYFEK